MNEEYAYETGEVSLNKKPELPLVWLLPICAFIVSGWLIYRSASEKGPVITIDFPTAEGLEIDKTKIRYLDVEIGKVTDISINDDSKTIKVTAQMQRDAENYLKRNTSFWVVRPQVGLAGISGLNTLLSGAYIEVKPGDGPHQHHFTGLASAPVLKTEAKGRQFVLETTDLGALAPRTQINFHGIPVGEVLSHELSVNADSIRLVIFIKAPYDQFVRKNTRFWKDSGIDLSAGADGFKVRTGSLVSMLSGGIAFRTPPNDTIKDVQPEYTMFHLYDNYEQSTQIEYRNTLKYVMYFNGSVRGLTEGAPVQLRGIPIGAVTGISLELDAKTADIRIPVTIDLEPDRIKEINKQPNLSNKDMMDRLIKKGLRAQLRTGSLLTGQLLVDLDFHPNSKITLHAHRGPYQEFPTIPSSLDQFTQSAQTIMDKVAKLPLEEMTTEINTTLKSLQGTSKAADALLTRATGTMGSADATLQSADHVLRSLEPGSTTRYELDKLLLELNQSANSVKQLADYLEQHPEALLRGKDDE
ncbi:MAG: PqiB family protein [Gammaproteobacteria bacterium]